MECPNCSKKITDDSKFCTYCGTEIIESLKKLKYSLARKRVNEIKNFYKHLIIYSIINSVLIIINFITSPKVIWFNWILILWGIGLLFHIAKVFIFPIINKWQERKIKEIMKHVDE